MGDTVLSLPDLVQLRAARLLVGLIYAGPADEGRRAGGEGVTEQLNESCNYLFTTLISPADSPIEPDRTRPTVTHAGTAHALFTG